VAGITIREMTSDDEYFVGTCSHVNESAEHDACGRRRLDWLHATHDRGVRALVARVDGKHAGFAYVMPIEVSPWGPLGRDLAVLNCLWVLEDAKHIGVGHALLAAAEDEARRQQRKALVTGAYYHDFWFMPAAFFEACGFAVAARREQYALLWKIYDPTAEPPTFLEPHHEHEPVPGRITVDLFWNPFCATSSMEAQRVREVAAEFGPRVVLREFDAGNRETLLRHQRPRGIFINGKEIGWGYDAPKEGIRAAIEEAAGTGSAC
jgi:GNAT superfamily N-acetyltransferase